MAEYIPKFDKENKELLILDTVFRAEECMEYAIRHNMNVLFTNTTSTSSVKVMMNFQKNGFNYKLYEKPAYAPDGTELEPEVFCLFQKSRVKEVLNEI